MKLSESIEQLTGITKPEQDEIFMEVKANSKRLESCVRHEFTICLDRHSKQPIPNPTPQQLFGAKWACNNCTGYVDSIYKKWYELGLKHGGDTRAMDAALEGKKGL